MIYSSFLRNLSSKVFLNFKLSLSPTLFESFLSDENPFRQTNLSLDLEKKKSDSKIASFINKGFADICFTTSANQVSSFIFQNDDHLISSKSSKQLIVSTVEQFGFGDGFIDDVQIEKIENSILKIEADGVASLFNQDSKNDVVFEDDLNEVELTFKSSSGYKIRSPRGIGALYFGRETKIEIMSSHMNSSFPLTVCLQKSEQETGFNIQQVGKDLMNKVILSLGDSEKEHVLIEQTPKNTNSKQPIRWFGIFNSNFEDIGGNAHRSESSNSLECDNNSLCLLNVIDISEDIVQIPLYTGYPKFTQKRFIDNFMNLISHVISPPNH
jgi:hypothetical protein